MYINLSAIVLFHQNPDVHVYLPCAVVNGVTALEDLLVLDPVVLADGAAVDDVVEVESVLVAFDVLPMPPIS